MNKFDLEERLIKFAVNVINITDKLYTSYAGVHLAKQLIRSGTAPALNYAEAISAESRKDFIHKVKTALKELRETLICLRIISEKSLSKELKLLESAVRESNELISIFVTSIKTAKQNELSKSKI